MELTNSITKIEECLSDIDKWMSINRLKLNKDKTELLYLFSKYNPQQCLPPLRFGTDIIKPSSYARNIGAIFNTTMSMPHHVNNVCGGGGVGVGDDDEEEEEEEEIFLMNKIIVGVGVEDEGL